MTLNKRLDKVEKSLTPKQTVVLWLQEIQPYRNAEKYVRFLRSQPESAAPITRLTIQIDQTVRTSMKGQPKEVISAAVHRAVKDVVFLVKLHLQVNYYLMTEERVWGVMFAALEGNLRAVTRENLYQRFHKQMVDISSREIPYPLEPETAGAVSAAICNYVTTWGELDEDDTLAYWLNNHLLDHGVRELPEGAYKYDGDGKCRPLVDADNEKEVRDCFQDATEFERFKAGEDYSKGLANIKDADYDAHYNRMVRAIHKLVDSGQVQGGTSVFLETVPIPFLQLASLIEGEWLDCHVVILAEVGATLINQGYQLQETNDQHPLAWPHFIDSSGSELGQDEIQNLLKQVSRRLKRSPGRTKEIGGRPYISFEDYCSWEGRTLKGDLHSNVSAGFTTASWNTWFDAGSGKRRLACVPVARLHCYVAEHDYLVCPNGADGQLKRRASLLGILSKAGSSRPSSDETFWKDMTGVFLTKMYTVCQAVTTISQQYFNGEELLFPDLALSFAELIKNTEMLVAAFNDEINGKPEDKIDLETIRYDADKTVTQQISYLVDMAKAEALSCLGDEQAAVKMAERYL